MRRLLVLLLLSHTGCFSIQGPESVRALEGESITVRCDYKPRWETYRKWWCRGAHWDLCRTLVQTTGSQQEVKEDRVSIRDNQSHRFLTVTMEQVRQSDTDTYWCGISKSGPDLGARIRVTIEPEGTLLTTLASMLSRTSANGRAGLSSVSYGRTHYILLVFVKVPILLTLAGVLLWLKGSQ
ncbi:CMRF35-like molecule 7 isoform X1 [Suricata suricatta]|uniref:CMRF35-like molecule 7 isoform X1 n=1 Tax=Suricata suricatta TaxID=37032 RepID=UPI001155A915|nr:CMRF35-like molecule 7 isoform X1 [Suricata suricatta]